MPLNTGYNSDLVVTEIDELVEEEFDRGAEPDEVLATDSLFFSQDSTDRQAVIAEETMGPGKFESHVEEEEVKEATIRSGNSKTYTVISYKNGYHIPVEFYEDDQHRKVQMTAREFGNNARISRDEYAFNNSYGDAFSGVTTPDGSALCSNSHTNLNGDTIDNLETASLSATNLDTLIRSLRLQKKQDGMLGAHNPAGLLVPPALFKSAVEITESELKPGSADNDLNFYSNVYPGLRVGTSAFLSSTYNSLNSNVDTSYFVIGRFHHVVRWERLGLTTDLVDYRQDEQHRYWYHGRFREIVGAEGWEGLVGSDGSA